MNHLIELLVLIGFIFLISIAIMETYSVESILVGPIIRPALNVKEAYTDLMPESYNSEYTIDTYSLLSDVIPLKTEGLGTLNAESCYAGDFQTRIEKTGNYRQLTNNYKRGDPDSCSSLHQEFTSAFYKVEPLL